MSAAGIITAKSTNSNLAIPKQCNAKAYGQSLSSGFLSAHFAVSAQHRERVKWFMKGHTQEKSPTGVGCALCNKPPTTLDAAGACA